MVDGHLCRGLGGGLLPKDGVGHVRGDGDVVGGRLLLGGLLRDCVGRVVPDRAPFQDDCGRLLLGGLLLDCGGEVGGRVRGGGGGVGGHLLLGGLFLYDGVGDGGGRVHGGGGEVWLGARLEDGGDGGVAGLDGGGVEDGGGGAEHLDEVVVREPHPGGDVLGDGGDGDGLEEVGGEVSDLHSLLGDAARLWFGGR